MSKISKRPASEDREEGKASDGASRDSRMQVACQAPALSRDPIKKLKDNSRAERTVKSRAKGVEEGIYIGKRDSAGISRKIEHQNTQIKERDKKINKQEKQIKSM